MPSSGFEAGRCYFLIFMVLLLSRKENLRFRRGTISPGVVYILPAL